MTKNLHGHCPGNNPLTQTQAKAYKLRSLMGLFAVALAQACVADGNTPEDAVADGDADPASAAADEQATGTSQQGLDFRTKVGGSLGEDRILPWPYPVITSFGVYSREVRGPFGLCRNVPQGAGATIDLRDEGCSSSIFSPFVPQSYRTRYFASVNADNPDNEQFTYDWALYFWDQSQFSWVRDDSSSEPTFDLYAGGNIAESTDPCYISVTVSAPNRRPRYLDSTRTVWWGNCTHYTQVLR